MNHALKMNSQALTVSGMTRDEQITHDVRKLMNVNNSKTRVINETKRKKIGGNKMSKFLK
jgi:hypothetical protein